MKSIFVLAAVLCLGNLRIQVASVEVQTESSGKFPHLPSGIFRGVSQLLQSGGSSNGLGLNLLNGIGGLQNNIAKDFIQIFLKYPGNLLINLNDTDTVEDLKRHCIANANASVYNEVEEASNVLKTCITTAIPNLQLFMDTQFEICKSMHRNFHKCMTDFVKKIDMCMDETSAYIPGYNIEVFDSIFNFLCDEEADHLTTLVKSVLRRNSCLEYSQNCLSKTKKFTKTSVALFRNITKTDLCIDTDTWKGCIIENSEIHCTEEMYDLVTGLTKAIFQPCSASTSILPNTFIVLLFIIFTKLY